MNVFLDEACTQAEVLETCLKNYFEKDNKVLDEIKNLYYEKGFNRILFAGIGSSYYAPYCVSGMLSRKGIPSSVFNAFDLSRNNFEQVTSDTLLVCISQSGKSWEVVELANKAKGVTTVVGIFNKEGSPLSEIVDYSLLIYAGDEWNISNKTYLCTQAVLNIFAHVLIDEFNDAFKTECNTVKEWIAGWLKDYQSNTGPLYELAKDTLFYDFFADGESFSTVNQAALIFREGPEVFTGTTESSDYAHGWYWAQKPGYLGLNFAPNYTEDSADKKMVDRTLENKGKIILFTQSKVDKKPGLEIVSLPNVRKSLVPLMEIIPCDTLMGLILGEGWTR